MLDEVFSGVVVGALDIGRISAPIRGLWHRTLDRCDLKSIDYKDCKDFVEELMRLCEQIFEEASGISLEQFGTDRLRYEELQNAWKHFVRMIGMRYPAWDGLVRRISDPNRAGNKDESYYRENTRVVVHSRCLKNYGHLYKFGTKL